MPIYSYKKEIKTLKKKVVDYFSHTAFGIGILLLFWAFYPVISFEIYSKLFMKQDIVMPVPYSEAISTLTLAPSVFGNYTRLSDNLRDLTQADRWFPNIKQNNSAQKISISQYELSIPKLNIERAKVVVGGQDLTKSLVHYLPTSLPGEFGNVAIFGHSTLPQLYNPKDYKTIFTYLPSLEKGDKVLIYINGIDYEYEIYEMFVVKPDKVSVLNQKYDGSYITLITCVPPGTYWNRLVVKAKLIKLPDNL